MGGGEEGRVGGQGRRAGEEGRGGREGGEEGRGGGQGRRARMEVVAGGWWQENGGVAGVAGGLVWLVWWVFGMAYRYRTEPKLRNTGNTYAAKHRIRIGIDRTARLQPNDERYCRKSPQSTLQ